MDKLNKQLAGLVVAIVVITMAVSLHFKEMSLASCTKLAATQKRLICTLYDRTIDDTAELVLKANTAAERDFNRDYMRQYQDFAEQLGCYEAESNTTKENL